MRFADLTAVITVAAALTALPATAAAGLYKCELDSGITYQQTPCPAGRELRDFTRDPASVSVVPFAIAPESVPPKASRSSAKPTPPRAQATGEPGARAPAKSSAARAGDASTKAAERKFLIPGIYEGEVLARVGSPDVKSGKSRKTMRWTYLPAPDDPSTITTLTFHEGRLIEVERKVVRAK